MTFHLARKVPVATSRANAWKPVVAKAKGVAAAWADRDPQLGAALVRRFWSEAAWQAYSSAEQVSGDPLDAVPAIAVPHFRAAAAARYLATTADAGQSLKADVVRLQAALAWRAQGPERIVPAPVRVSTFILWNETPAELAHLKVVPYSGTDLRPVATNELADLAICLLEAEAHVRDPNGAFEYEGALEQGLEYPDEAVRAVARLLLGRIRGMARTGRGRARAGG